ncbi:MAG: L-seryl-tRNA(Sec) selenium transferase [Candidatus Limnocylindrales bacterium]
MSEPGSGRPPSVERLLATARPRLVDRDHDALVVAARGVLADERAALAGGAAGTPLPDLADVLVERLTAWTTGDLVSVLNATGVLLHTNLGRAPWAEAAIRAASEAAEGYSLLELDRATGRRGPRFRAAEEHLVALTGAEDALVTNNNAAAVALAVGLAGRAGRVIVGRGELVEIGGGVRIPEIVRRAGARLIEVGTTNRTRLADYAEGFEDRSARLILRVHASNFRMEGFVEQAGTEELADLAHERGARLVDDLGSGALLDTARYGLAHEPTPQESLAAGADLVTFSGDKLLGGPQAGLLAGRAELIARLRRDPLARAMRPDKVTLAALSATLGLYRAGRVEAEIPVWQMIATTAHRLRARSEALAGRLAAAERPPGWSVEATQLESTVGGGSLPGETLPSWGLRLTPDGARQGRSARTADALLARLRAGQPCVMARIGSGAVLLDLRTIAPEADEALARALAGALGGSTGDLVA